jgi:hypothetical protein
MAPITWRPSEKRQLPDGEVYNVASGWPISINELA